MTLPEIRDRAISHWTDAFAIIVVFVALLWLIETINAATGHRLSYLGIYPREYRNLPGIIFSPFLHASFQHLMFNTTPLLILGYFVALRGWQAFLQVCGVIVLLGGLGVWIFGRPAFHLGASGLVFGFFGFLVAVGIYERSLSALGIGTFIVFYYGGLLIGIVPVPGFVSFEAHFFGLLAGVLAARLLAIRPRRIS